MFETENLEGPIFKILPKNDTADAAGHQAGFVIPKDFADFFPELPLPTQSDPVPSKPIRVEMFVGTEFLGEAAARYQLQTWGLTRAGERRVTDILELRSQTSTNDILLMQRNLDDIDLFRFTLIRKNNPVYDAVKKIALKATKPGKRWGELPSTLPMISRKDLLKESESIAKKANETFALFDENPDVSIYKRLVRDRAFRGVVLAAYNKKCAFCLGGLEGKLGVTEVEGAHIVSKSAKGADDVRNGLALCRAHHWAFDRLLVSISEDRKIIVANWAAKLDRNAMLIGLEGKTLLEPTDPAFRPDPAAIAWHRQRFAP